MVAGGQAGQERTGPNMVGRQAPRAGMPPGATPREDRSSEPDEMDLCDVGEETR